jgi:hypothetical protein
MDMANQPNIVVSFCLGTTSSVNQTLAPVRGVWLFLGTSLRFTPIGKPKVAQATARSVSTAHVSAGTGAKAVA